MTAQTHTSATPIKFVGVAGSGTMGVGVAEVAARSGLEVILRSRTQAKAESARDRVAASLARDVDKGKLSADQRDEIVARVRPTANVDDLGLCDLVVESVVEDLAAKKAVFADLDRYCGAAAVMATNTSTLSVGDLARVTSRPEQVVGTHFFNPAPRMPLVEIVRAPSTSDETLARARQFAQACGKEPVTVKDRAGFVVNALLFPYLNAAVEMLESGTASKEDIDAAMRGGCGMPMGPFELLDLVGLDTSVSILDTLHAAHGTESTLPAATLKQMVAEGQLGKKSSQGFYSY